MPTGDEAYEKTSSLRDTKDPASSPPLFRAIFRRARVSASFGAPTKVIVLPTKEIDFYQDMKVTFVNGKVSNVQ